MAQILLVGCGGFLGSVTRYLLGGWIQRVAPTSVFPWGTLGVNVLGCLLIGWLGALAEQRGVLDAQLRALLAIGFLGGFTTFSAFGWETMALAREASIGRALANCALHLVLGLAAVWLGMALAKAV